MNLSRSWFFLFILVLVGALPLEARADLYIYETPSGETLITNDRHPTYKLIEHIPSNSTPQQSKASSAKQRSQTPSNAKKPNRSSNKKRMSFSQREGAYDDIIREAARTYNVPFGFIKAVIRVESAFQPEAVSHAGAQGLMQLMPRTAESVNVSDPFDPRQNIFGGTKFLRILTDRYDGDINLILAAYNAGDVAVRRHNGIPYAQTRNYVASVYHWYQVYSADESSQ